MRAQRVDCMLVEPEVRY